MKQVPLGPHRYMYRDHLLSCAPFDLGNGRFRAQVAVAYVGGEKTRSQRFIDLPFVGNEQEAVVNAQKAGADFVDDSFRG